MAGREPGLTTAPAGVGLLVVGEALVDVVHRPASAGPAPGPPAPERHVGGSPANVAIGVARLGHPVTLAACLGPDDDGTLIRRRLDEDGVGLLERAVARTSTAVATLDAAGHAAYRFDLIWQQPDLPPAGHLHVGSIAALSADGRDAVRALSQTAAGGGTTSYDPNLRPDVLRAADVERPVVESLVRAADVVKASDEDLSWLYPDQAPERSAAAWAQLGPALVVLTCGERGARLWWGGPGGSGLEPVPCVPVDVVDTVGAGDAFMAGLLSGLVDAGLLGLDRRAALRVAGRAEIEAAGQRAALAAALTCARPGAQPPTRAELAGQSPG